MLLDFFFPKFCIGCGYVGKYICGRCRRKLPIKYEQECHVCRQKLSGFGVHRECAESTWLEGVYVVWNYQGVIQKLVHEVKYNQVKDILVEVAEMVAKIVGVGFFSQFDVITWAPTTKIRSRQRGFDQAALLSEYLLNELSKTSQMKIPRRARLLERAVQTQTQVGQNKEQRMQNLQQVFKATSEFEEIFASTGQRPLNILILDDVMTTGSTLEQCARALKSSQVTQSGNISVHALVLGRG